MAQAVETKGIRDGLLIRVSDSPDVVVEDALRLEIDRKRAFLAGGRLALEIGRRELTYEALAELQRLFEARELVLWAVLAEHSPTRESARRLGLATRLSGSATDLEGNALRDSPPLPANGDGVPATRDLPGANALLLRETVRSGRSIWHDGHVIVLGDVNPGAEVIAGGSVIVWGRLRGLVHAGALGDESAVICALELNPTQLRIADQIAVAPDGGPVRAPEQAAIRDGQIIAEPWAARHGA